MKIARLLIILGLIVMILGLLASIALGIVLLAYFGRDWVSTGIGVLVGGSLGSLISGGVLIGFGQLIEISDKNETHNREIRDMFQQMKEKGFSSAVKTVPETPNPPVGRAVPKKQPAAAVPLGAAVPKQSDPRNENKFYGVVPSPDPAGKLRCPVCGNVQDKGYDACQKCGIRFTSL